MAYTYGRRFMIHVCVILIKRIISGTINYSIIASTSTYSNLRILHLI